MIKTEKEETLYNVMFPIWFLLVFPVTWIVVLPVNFIIDSIVLLICAKVLRLADLKAIYKRSILKVWLIGFGSDFLGAGILFLSTDSTAGWYEYLRAVSWNPFDNWYALLFVALAVAVAGIAIYFGNMKYSLKNVEISLGMKRRLALTLAILTAPYVLFYPSSLLNGGSWDDLKFMTNHILKMDEFRLEVALNDSPSGNPAEENVIMYYYEQDMQDAINEAEKTDHYAAADPGQPDIRLLFYKRDYSAGKEIPVWIDRDQGYFQYKQEWYALNKPQLEPLLKALHEVQNVRGKKEFEIIPDPTKSLPGGESGSLDKEGKKDSEYPVFEDSRNRYFYPERQKFDGAVIRFAGREDIDVYTALVTGLITPQDLIDHGMELIVEKRND